MASLSSKEHGVLGTCTYEELLGAREMRYEREKPLSSRVIAPEEMGQQDRKISRCFLGMRMS